MEIIDGKKLAKTTRENLRLEVEELKGNGINPKLAVIMVGNNSASQIYVRNKSNACADVGVEYVEYLLEENIEQEELMELIKKLNEDKTINGILLQSPIPMHLDINEAFKTITYVKDVDGFSPASVGKLCIGEDTFISCTPYGVMKMLEEYNIDLNGKHVVILGRSNIVGKPLIQCCLQKNATVTICHSKTQKLEEITKQADVLISAIGQPEFVKNDMIKDKAVVIDVGINVDEDGNLCGDVDFEDVAENASVCTPVPGGVGSVTTSVLAKHLLKAAKARRA